MGGIGQNSTKGHDSRSARLGSVDALRGGAALAVLLYHAVRYRESDDLPAAGWFRALYEFLQLGHVGVPLFFVISGFCIHARWARKYAETGDGSLDFLSFWRRRLHRLYPPYLVTLVLCMGLVVLSYAAGISSPLVDRYPEPRLRWIEIDFIAHLGMLHGFHPILDHAGGNVPFWTLAREEYFYALYFALLSWRRRRGLGFTLGVVLAIGLVFPPLMTFVLAPNSPWRPTVNTSALALWVQWCLGMVAVEGYYGVVTLPAWCRSPWALFAWAGGALLVDRYAPLLSPLLWGMTFFTTINACIGLERVGRWPSGALSRWMSRVGVYSYSIYLIHYPVRSMMKRALGPLSATSNPFVYLANTLAISAAGFAAGYVFFLLVERHFLNGAADKRPSRAFRRNVTEPVASLNIS